MVVPLGTNAEAPGFWASLDAIRESPSVSAVSVTMLCPESAGPETIGRLRKYADSARVSLVVTANGPVDLLNQGLGARPSGADVLLLSPSVLIRPELLQGMIATLYSDEMFGFAAPRSNAPTLAQFPCLPEDRNSRPVGGREGVRRAFPAASRISVRPAATP